MVELLRNGHAVEDQFGIVTKAKERRETYAKFIERRVAQTIDSPAVRTLIAKLVDERLREEIDTIVARRSAETIKEMGADSLIGGPAFTVIMHAVAEATNTTVAELCGPRRRREVARPRQMAYWLIRRLRPDLSFPQIAHMIGGRDHTTVLAGMRRFEKLVGTDEVAHWLKHPAIARMLK